MSRAYDVATSWASSILELGVGLVASRPARAPERLLELYEFEACPYCRKVREALTELDLDAKIFPCPPRGVRFRPEAARMGGKPQFPYLVDPNTERRLYESDDIVRYLAAQYGDGAVPLGLALGPLSTARAMLAGLPRMTGHRARQSRAPELPLELYSFEASPYCRIVREALSRLELHYILHNVAKRGRRREAFLARSGKMMVPYLVDPNTGRSLFESAEIVRYLESTYGA